MMNYTITRDRKYLNLIKVVSVLIPMAVAVLIYLPGKLNMGEWVRALPTVNAFINTMTSLFLLAALISVRRKNIELHKRFMTFSLVLGTVFLLSYVTYHASVPSVKYGDLDFDGQLSSAELMAIGGSRSIYLFFLLSHIALSIVVVPFVLFSFFYSLSGQIERHRKIVKFSFPIWLYVSVTGVIVYLMISPYYG